MKQDELDNLVEQLQDVADEMRQRNREIEARLAQATAERADINTRLLVIEQVFNMTGRIEAIQDALK